MHDTDTVYGYAEYFGVKFWVDQASCVAISKVDLSYAVLAVRSLKQFIPRRHNHSSAYK